MLACSNRKTAEVASSSQSRAKGSGREGAALCSRARRWGTLIYGAVFEPSAWRCRRDSVSILNVASWTVWGSRLWKGGTGTLLRRTTYGLLTR